ncbi:hypothetical protein BH23THE1_BH23THE1_07640 [soil metagenome]
MNCKITQGHTNKLINILENICDEFPCLRSQVGCDIMLKKMVIGILSINLISIFGFSMTNAYPNASGSTMEQQMTNQILEFEMWNCAN